MKSGQAKTVEDELVEIMAECAGDPLLFVQMAFPWGEAGDLAAETGPDDWQVKILTDVRDGLSVDKALLEAVASGHGVGKLQTYDDEVETPSGRRRWGDLGVGDLLFAADGCHTQIVQTHHHRSAPMYRVTFDDGASLDVSSGHLWNVRGRQERRKNLPGWRTLETIDILERGVKRANGTSLARQWEIPIQGAARFDAREIDLHPYVLGIWLGDGSRRAPSYCKPFPEIADRIRALGYEVHAALDGKMYRLQNVAHLFRGGVFDCGSPERFIPDDYKYNTVENRMALFQGLCDSDGEVHASGSIGYSTTSKALADDVVWLARSLGCKAAIQDTIKAPWYSDASGARVEGLPCFRLTINAPFNPFTIEHRRVAYKPSEARYLCRWIDSIEPIEPQDGMCVTVSAPDGLYQARDFIVTHNSALVAWLILWAMATFPDTKGIVTANTQAQLKTKTWPELAKWYRIFIAKHWFNLGATSIESADPEHAKTWRIDAIPWSEKNTEAFAGMHNQGKRIAIFFDEASAIPDVIHETTEGALTDADTEILWFQFGNPTRNTGRFRECFGRLKHRWTTYQVDSRNAKLSNKAQIAQWIADYGEDSDFVRIRVRGIFPRAGAVQFIPGDIVEAAMSPAREQEIQTTFMDPLILGVDVARFGDDQTVLCTRRGLDAKSIPWRKLRGKDTMQVAALIVEMHVAMNFDAIFIDEGGIGAGVVDRCRFLKLPVMGINNGSEPDLAMPTDEGTVGYNNKGAEMWGRMRDWIKRGLLPHDTELEANLTGREYGYVMRDGRDVIQLEKKKDMKKRGLASPDDADALALTFAYPVQPSDHRAQLGGQPRHQVEYSPFASAYAPINSPGNVAANRRAFLPHSNR